MTTTAVEALEHARVKAAGYSGLFNSHITSPIALGALAAPSAYHLATGNDASDSTKDMAEVGGLGLLIHGELPDFAKAVARRGRI